MVLSKLSRPYHRDSKHRAPALPQRFPLHSRAPASPHDRAAACGPHPPPSRSSRFHASRRWCPVPRPARRRANVSADSKPSPASGGARSPGWPRAATGRRCLPWLPAPRRLARRWPRSGPRRSRPAPRPPSVRRRYPLPFVSPIFGDHMVLQRGKPNVIWGWSQPGDAVRVEIGETAETATTGADGRWQTRIQPPAPGGPYTVKITGGETVELHDVLVGDVWICAGQSNIHFGLPQARNGAEEVKNADQPTIRYYVVGQRSSYSHVDVPRGSWRVVSPGALGGRGGGISAAAYFFGRRVQESIHVPIGLIQEAVGGVPAETFTSAEGLHPLKDFDVPIAEVERLRQKGGPEYGYYFGHWYDEYDIGTKGGWADPALDDSSWKTVQVPGGFKELGVGDAPGLYWFRKEITLPATLPEGMARLYLGSIEKMDTTFINGRQVGSSSWVENPRVYFAGGALQPGRNVIAIRLFKLKPDGGFISPAADLHLTLGDGTSIPLSGEWKGKVAVDGHPPQPLPLGYENLPIMPGVLYNGMLAPIVPIAITGAIWYQGASNTERAYQYRKLLPAMIADWRKQFGQGDFPFYVVSLPAYKHPSM